MKQCFSEAHSLLNEELAVNLVCMAVSDQERYQMVKGLQKQSKKSLIPMPVPTIDLGDL